jgi:hypothetical protein
VEKLPLLSSFAALSLIVQGALYSSILTRVFGWKKEAKQSCASSSTRLSTELPSVAETRRTLAEARALDIVIDRSSFAVSQVVVVPKTVASTTSS